MSQERIQSLIHRNQLIVHPEGGLYRRFYESKVIIDYNGYSRPSMTSIYYLLVGSECSHFHRIDADEIWYYHEGNTQLILHVFYKAGSYEKVILGHELGLYQFCVPAGSWFAAEVAFFDENKYVFSSCTVSPGFLFETFELASVSHLLALYPEYEALIMRMTL